MIINIDWQNPHESVQFKDIPVGQPYAVTFNATNKPEVYLKVHDAGSFRLGDSGDIMAVDANQQVHKLGLEVFAWLDLS